MKLRYAVLPIVALFFLVGCSSALIKSESRGAESAMRSKIFAVQQSARHRGINYVYQSIKGT